MASGVMAGVEGFHQIRAASLGLAPDTTVVGGLRWTVASKILGATAGMVSIWDGMKKMTEAAEAARTGSSLSARSSMIVGGVGLTAGIASIAVIAASTGIGLVASLFIGIFTLAIGYWFVTLVSPAVQMWVNRSILGKKSGREDMQVLAFEDMASEQSSLEMVFQGVMVQLSWEKVTPDTAKFARSEYDIDTEGLVEEIERARGLVKIKLKIIVPNLDTSELLIQLTPHSQPETIFDWTYHKTRKDGALKFDSMRGSRPSAKENDHPSFKAIDNIFAAEWSNIYDKNVLTSHIDLVIKFRSLNSRSFKNDTLSIKL